jgi:Rab GDP dissociation inhibitor
VSLGTGDLLELEVARDVGVDQHLGHLAVRHHAAVVKRTEMEAIKSPLLGLFEKRRARNFFLWVQNYNEENPSA